MTEMSSALTPSRSRRPWLLTAILAAALLLRLGLVFGVRDIGIHTDDERDYVKLAQSLEADQRFGYDSGSTSMRPPLYPAFVALTWAAAGAQSLTAVRLAQTALSLASIVLVFLLGRRLFTPTAGLWAAALWAFYPSFLYANVLVLTEVLFTCLLLAACLCAVAAASAPERAGWWALGVGLAVGLAALTRSVLWPFPIVLAPALAWVTAGSWRQRGFAALGVLVGYLAVVAPWAIRNTSLQQTFVVVDTMGGLNLRMGNYEYTIEDRMWDGVSLTGDKAWSHEMVLEHPEASQWTEGQRDRWARQRATDYMLSHPWTTVRRSALKFADFWGLEREYIAALQAGKYPVPGWFQAVSSVAVLGAYVVLMVMACFGLFLAPWPQWRRHVVPLLAVVWVCAIHSIVFGHSRYHLPVMPILLVYSAAALSGLSWRWTAVVAWRRTAVACALLALVCIWGREVLVRDADRIRHFMTAQL